MPFNIKNKLRAIITGGAGFIGSQLADRLIMDGHEVIIIDNLSNGKKEFINPNAQFIEGDLKNRQFCVENVRDVDVLFHLAADVDVRLGVKNPNLDFNENVVGTDNILEAMRINNIKKIVFTSSSVVYGNATVMPTPETYGPLIPISLYGASKLADEALISGYCHTFGIQSWVFRFANVIGSNRQTHGIIVDFINKLRDNPNELEILGDGNQTKSYIYIEDCINAILHGFYNSNEKVNIFNLGSDDFVNVKTITDLICNGLGLNPEYKFTGGEQGWVGDVSHMQLDCSKLKELGWVCHNNSEESIKRSIEDLK